MSSPKETKDPNSAEENGNGSNGSNESPYSTPSSSPSSSSSTLPPPLTSNDNLFIAGPGLLARVQAAKTTLQGRRISHSMIDHLLTAEEVANLAAALNAPTATYSSGNSEAPTPQQSPFLGPPFNALSPVTKYLGLGGFASLTADNLATVFAGRRLALIINATYEVPAFRPKVQVDKEGKTEEEQMVESLRIPVGDDGEADLYSFFADFTDKIQAMLAKEPKTVAIVHCMAGE